jgi:hypothetical protein
MCIYIFYFCMVIQHMLRFMKGDIESPGIGYIFVTIF